MSKSATTIKPVHPGEILSREYLVPFGLSASRFAKHINVPPDRVSSIVNGSRGVTGDTALRFAKALDTTPEFWMNIQTHYDLEAAKDKGRGELDSIAKLSA